MSALDEDVRVALYTYFLPVVLLIIAFPIFLKTLKSLKPRATAFIYNIFCKRLHGKFVDEKGKLFGFKPNEELSSPFLLSSSSKRPLQILEIGAGSGLNFKYYPDGSEITCLDPNKHHKTYIVKNLEKINPKVKLKSFVKGYAEDMSCFEDQTFDVVVETLVMCSVEDPKLVLKEVQRVLKPRGVFYFLDHVGGKHSSWLRFFQNRFNPILKIFTDNCEINRDTGSTIRSSGFSHVDLTSFNLKVWFILIRPCIYGVAVK